ncbi:MAG: chemotaxis protein CheW [Bryobacteraceae bacterium]
MTAAAQYLTFTVGDQTYGVDILDVHEIRGGSPVTPVPNAPPYVRGVMNLRGTVVPVIDLRRRFGAPETDFGSFTVIVVAAVAGRIVGFVVDTVAEVSDLGDGKVTAPPALDGGGERFVSGVVAAAGGLVLLLDLPALVGACNGARAGEDSAGGRGLEAFGESRAPGASGAAKDGVWADAGGAAALAAAPGEERGMG